MEGGARATKGPCTYDVRKISGIFDPLPPLVQDCPILHNPLPLLDIILPLQPPPYIGKFHYVAIILSSK